MIVVKQFLGLGGSDKGIILKIFFWPLICDIHKVLFDTYIHLYAIWDILSLAN